MASDVGLFRTVICYLLLLLLFLFCSCSSVYVPQWQVNIFFRFPICRLLVCWVGGGCGGGQLACMQAGNNKNEITK